VPLLILGMLRAIWALRRDSQFVSLGLLTLIALVSGTGFYSLVEGLRFVDALYFSVVTLTTVGYGDFAPETDVGKLFTAVYVLVGIGILLAFVTTLAGKMSQTSPLHFGGRPARGVGSRPPSRCPSPVKADGIVPVGDSLLGRTPGEERSVEEADDARCSYSSARSRTAAVWLTSGRSQSSTGSRAASA
jgi:voltage-gated potassium channel